MRKEVACGSSVRSKITCEVEGMSRRRYRLHDVYCLFGDAIGDGQAS